MQAGVCCCAISAKGGDAPSLAAGWMGVWAASRASVASVASVASWVDRLTIYMHHLPTYRQGTAGAARQAPALSPPRRRRHGGSSPHLRRHRPGGSGGGEGTRAGRPCGAAGDSIRDEAAHLLYRAPQARHRALAHRPPGTARREHARSLADDCTALGVLQGSTLDCESAGGEWGRPITDRFGSDDTSDECFRTRSF